MVIKESTEAKKKRGARRGTQRELMQRLYQSLGPEKEKVCAAFAAAEKNGEIARRRNAGSNSAEQYASDLWSDGKRKGWLAGS
jgi:hypothetical protein